MALLGSKAGFGLSGGVAGLLAVFATKKFHAGDAGTGFLLAARGAGVVLGADTVVVLDGQVLGKPGGAGEAGAMLRRLRGREHEVITGIAAVDAGRGREASRAVVSRVLMADYSDATLDAYVASGAPLDKAGAYAIQDLGGALVARLVGSYTNVVGLPVEETRELLAGFGVLFSAPQSP